MSVEELVLDTLKQLPPEKQQQVLDYARSLTEPGRKKPLRNLMGAFEDLNINITAEDIDEARREMWGPYMGEDPK